MLGLILLRLYVNFVRDSYGNIGSNFFYYFYLCSLMLGKALLRHVAWEGQVIISEITEELLLLFLLAQAE